MRLVRAVLASAAVSATAASPLTARADDLFVRQSIVAMRPAGRPGGDLKIGASGVTVLPRSAARSCDARGCTFDFGVEALRISKDLPLVTAIRLAASGGGAASGGAGESGDAAVERTVRFSGLAITARTVIRLRLPFGDSTLTATVDPEDTTPESDETNNRFAVRVRLRGPR